MGKMSRKIQRKRKKEDAQFIRLSTGSTARAMLKAQSVNAQLRTWANWEKFKGRHK